MGTKTDKGHAVQLPAVCIIPSWAVPAVSGSRGDFFVCTVPQPSVRVPRASGSSAVPTDPDAQSRSHGHFWMTDAAPYLSCLYEVPEPGRPSHIDSTLSLALLRLPIPPFLLDGFTEQPPSKMGYQARTDFVCFTLSGVLISVPGRPSRSVMRRPNASKKGSTPHTSTSGRNLRRNRCYTTTRESKGPSYPRGYTGGEDRGFGFRRRAEHETLYRASQGRRRTLHGRRCTQDTYRMVLA